MFNLRTWAFRAVRLCRTFPGRFPERIVLAFHFLLVHRCVTPPLIVKILKNLALLHDLRDAFEMANGFLGKLFLKESSNVSCR